jgi:hypothetical protein
MPNPKMLKRERERLLQERAQAKVEKRQARKAERAARANGDVPPESGTEDETTEEIATGAPSGDPAD